MKVKVTTGVSRIAFAVPDFLPLTVAVQQTAPTVTSAASISGTTAPTGLLTLTEGTASGNPAPTGCTAIGPHDENKYDAYGGFMSDYGFDSDATITGVSFNGNQITVTFATAPAWLSYAMQVQDIRGHTDGTGYSYTAHRGVLAWDWEQASLFDHSYTHRLWLPTDMWVPK